MNRLYAISKDIKPGHYGGKYGTGECDINLYPELPSIVATKEIDRIISIGDIHGDLDLSIRYLEIPKLICRVYEENDMTVTLWYKEEKLKRIYQWIGTKTIVVQVGDQVDRCRPNDKPCHHPDATINDEASDLTIMFFYNDLHVVAQKVGCALYSLLGNHELLNVLGNFQYVSYKGLKEFPSTSHNIQAGRKQAFSTKSTDKIYKKQSTIAEFLGCSRLSAIIVNGYLFAHAGIMPELIDKMSTYTNNDLIVPTINNAVKSWLLNAYKKEEKPLITSLLAGTNMSPFWPRVFGSLKSNLDIETSECSKFVKPVLEALLIKGIIIGHTQQLKINISSTCSNTVWRVDIASSHAFDEVIFKGVADSDKQSIQKGRKPQVLEIKLNDLSTPTNNLDVFTVLIDP